MLTVSEKSTTPLLPEIATGLMRTSTSPCCTAVLSCHVPFVVAVPARKVSFRIAEGAGDGEEKVEDAYTARHRIVVGIADCTRAKLNVGPIQFCGAGCAGSAISAGA